METKTIRVSFGSLVLGVLILATIGVLGGYIGTRIFPAQAPLSSGNDRSIIPINQQVVISPNKSAQEIVRNTARSVYLLAAVTPRTIVSLGSATVLTNDGVFMSTIDTSEDNLLAIGENGQSIPLQANGRDALTGISFFKSAGQIVAPLELSQDTPSAGETLLAPYRQSDSAQVAVRHAVLSSTILPNTSDAPGLQKIAQLSIPLPVPAGTVLLDDSGKLAGAVFDPERGAALFVGDIRAALDRLSAGTLANNPFETLGFTALWEGQKGEDSSINIVSTVGSVEKDSPAGRGGLKIGDIITAIGSSTVTWDTPLVTLLNNSPPTITIIRQGEQRTLSFLP